MSLKSPPTVRLSGREFDQQKNLTEILPSKVGLPSPDHPRSFFKGHLHRRPLKKEFLSRHLIMAMSLSLRR